MVEFYRYFDKQGVLLFVGISAGAVQRLVRHKATPAWFSTIASVKVEHFTTRAAAQRAEIEAISSERPKYNATPSTAPATSNTGSGIGENITDSVGTTIGSIGLSSYDRADHDHYATPATNVSALVLGLQQAGIDMPWHVLDPCGGKGGIAHGLEPLGFKVVLTDLFPGVYEAAHGLYATTAALNAGNAAELRRAVSLSKARGIVTNPPYLVAVHGSIERACLELLQAGEIELLALMHLSSHLTTIGGYKTTTAEPKFSLRVDCAWRTVLFDSPDATTGKQTHSWRVWTCKPRRQALSAYPTVGVASAEAEAKIRDGTI